MHENEKKETDSSLIPKDTDIPILPAPVVEEEVRSSEPPQLTAPELIEPFASNTFNESEPAIMEVHTHGHVHEKKKWKEYLFQFIMLFLAVTAGFFAENQREHYVENHRAHGFAEAMVSDLAADTSEVTISGARMLAVAGVADSLLQQLNKPREQQNDSLIQLAIYRMNGYNFYDPQMGAYQQVKSSGALRYFRTEISQKLTRYENSTGYIGRLTDELIAFRTHMLMPYLISIQNGRFAASVSDKTVYNGPYFVHTPGPETLEQLYNYAVRLKSIYTWYVERMADHRKLAEELMLVLRKEYDVKD